MEAIQNKWKATAARILGVVGAVAIVIYWFATHEGQVISDRKFVAGVMLQKLGTAAGDSNCRADAVRVSCEDLEKHLPAATDKEQFFVADMAELVGVDFSYGVIIFMVGVKAENKVEWQCRVWPQDAAPRGCEVMKAAR